MTIWHSLPKTRTSLEVRVSTLWFAGSHDPSRAACGIDRSLRRQRCEVDATPSTPTIAEEVRILGPAPPPIAKLRGLYRFHIMLAAPDPAPLNRLLSRMVADMKPPEGIQFVIDIDPIDML